MIDTNPQSKKILKNYHHNTIVWICMDGWLRTAMWGSEPIQTFKFVVKAAHLVIAWLKDP